MACTTSFTRGRKVKELRATFKEWCVDLGCEVDQLVGQFLYLNNICALCDKQEDVKQGHVCTETGNPETCDSKRRDSKDGRFWEARTQEPVAQRAGI